MKRINSSNKWNKIYLTIRADESLRIQTDQFLHFWKISECLHRTGQRNENNARRNEVSTLDFLKEFSLRSVDEPYVHESYV